MSIGYTSYNEAVQREVIEPLGEFAEDHDIEAIAEEVIGTEGTGTDYIFVPIVSESEFWKIVERHAVK